MLFMVIRRYSGGCADRSRFGGGVLIVISCRGRWGEWRNGRRAGFRCQCPSGRGGSSPPSPTRSGSRNSAMRGQELERVPDLFLFVRFPVALRGSTRGSGLRNSHPDPSHRPELSQLVAETRIFKSLLRSSNAVRGPTTPTRLQTRSQAWSPAGIPIMPARGQCNPGRPSSLEPGTLSEEPL